MSDDIVVSGDVEVLGLEQLGKPAISSIQKSRARILIDPKVHGYKLSHRLARTELVANSAETPLKLLPRLGTKTLPSPP